MLKGKVHYVTIPEEEWTNVSLPKCFSFSRKYGVNGLQVFNQVCSGNTTNRTFPVVHLVPHLISKEELLGDRKALRGIVRERGLNAASVRKLRSYARYYQNNTQQQRTSDDEVEPCEAPPAPPHPATNDAIVRVYDTRINSCFGLHLLVTIQNEDTAAPADAGLGRSDASVRAQLRRLPLSVLHNFISEMWQVRSAWERELLTPSSAALAQEQAHIEDEKINALLYHICLWQRRYPLKLLLSVLAFHSEHRDVFLPTSPAEPCELYRVEQLLEELQRIQFPDLSDIPGLIRCDVLVTYPTMPLEEQMELMRSVTAACQRRANSDVTERGDDAQENTEEDAIKFHSRVAPNPQLLLKGFVPEGTIIPPRFCGSISRDAFREMRAAVESHKQDGVRRLALHDYHLVPTTTVAASKVRSPPQSHTSPS